MYWCSWSVTFCKLKLFNTYNVSDIVSVSWVDANACSNICTVLSVFIPVV